jgi:hypothetical protein
MSQDPLSTVGALDIESDEGEGENQIRIDPGKENACLPFCFFSKTASALLFHHSTPDYATRAT